MAGCWSASGRFLGLGSLGGTLRLKLATTSGGEWRLSVGWAKDHIGRQEEMACEVKGHLHQVEASGSSMAGSTLRRLTLRMKP
jgi:hypothetical protein